MVITKLKKKIPTAPVAHLFPLPIIDFIANKKLKIVMINCIIKLMIQTKINLIFIELSNDLFPILY